MRIILIISLPYCLFIWSYWYFVQLNKTDQLYTDKRNIKIAFKTIESALHPDVHIARKLYKAYIISPNPKSLQNHIKKIIRETGINLHYIIWTNKNKTVFTNLTRIDKKIKHVCQFIYDCRVNRKYKRGTLCPENETNILHEVFGPHFILANIASCYKSRNELINPDLAMNRPFLWLKPGVKFVLIAMINPSELQPSIVLANTIKNLDNFNNRILFGAKSNNEIIANTNSTKKIIQNLDVKNKNNIRYLNKFTLFQDYIGNRTTAFALIKKSSNKLKLLKIILLATFFVALFVFYFYKKFVSDLSSKINLLPKLSTFFILFNLIPTRFLT